MVVEQNRVSRQTFWPKREKAIQDRAKLDNEQLYDFYSSLNVIRAMRQMRHVILARQNKNTYKVLVWKPERMRSLERHKRRWTLKQIFRNWVEGHGLD
jgi:hypothetical protein